MHCVNTCGSACAFGRERCRERDSTAPPATRHLHVFRLFLHVLQDLGLFFQVFCHGDGHAALLPLEELLIEAWIKHPEQMAAAVDPGCNLGTDETLSLQWSWYVVVPKYLETDVELVLGMFFSTSLHLGTIRTEISRISR
jgi:hypothetical protein